MQINSSSPVSGLYQAQQQLNQSASTIASTSTTQGKTDAITPQVEMQQSSYQFSASLKAIKTEDEMLGSLIDIQA